MSEVNFPNEQVSTRETEIPFSERGFIGLVKKWGLAKDDSGALHVLIAFVCIVLVVSGAILFMSGSRTPDPVEPLYSVPVLAPQD